MCGKICIWIQLWTHICLGYLLWSKKGSDYFSFTFKASTGLSRQGYSGKNSSKGSDEITGLRCTRPTQGITCSSKHALIETVTGIHSEPVPRNTFHMDLCYEATFRKSSCGGKIARSPMSQLRWTQLNILIKTETRNWARGVAQTVYQKLFPSTSPPPGMIRGLEPSSNRKWMMDCFLTQYQCEAL